MNDDMSHWSDGSRTTRDAIREARSVQDTEFLCFGGEDLEDAL